MEKAYILFNTEKQQYWGVDEEADRCKGCNRYIP